LLKKTHFCAHLFCFLALFDFHPFEHRRKFVQSATDFRFWVRGSADGQAITCLFRWSF
jgi:hypothetical protein